MITPEPTSAPDSRVQSVLPNMHETAKPHHKLPLARCRLMRASKGCSVLWLRYYSLAPEQFTSPPNHFTHQHPPPDIIPPIHGNFPG